MSERDKRRDVLYPVVAEPKDAVKYEEFSGKLNQVAEDGDFNNYVEYRPSFTLSLN